MCLEMKLSARRCKLNFRVDWCIWNNGSNGFRLNYVGIMPEYVRFIMDWIQMLLFLPFLCTIRIYEKGVDEESDLIFCWPSEDN
jgi:hypothetical protein